MNPQEYQQWIMKHLWRLLKALPFKDGPSSTRAMYMLACTTIALCLVIMVLALCGVYIWTKGVVISVTLAGAIAAMTGALISAATIAQAKKNALAAALSKSEGIEPASPDAQKGVTS